MCTLDPERTRRLLISAFFVMQCLRWRVVSYFAQNATRKKSCRRFGTCSYASTNEKAGRDSDDKW